MKKILKLKFIELDNWSRPVYRGDDRKIYVDVDPGHASPSIHTKSGNDIEGEPGYPINKDIEVVFVPSRITW